MNSKINCSKHDRNFIPNQCRECEKTVAFEKLYRQAEGYLEEYKLLIDEVRKNEH